MSEEMQPRPDPVDRLAECLAAAVDDPAALDRCLAEHPQDEQALREMAALASELRELSEAPDPSPAFRADGYRRLMAEIAGPSQATARGAPLAVPLNTPVRLSAQPRVKLPGEASGGAPGKTLGQSTGQPRVKAPGKAPAGSRAGSRPLPGLFAGRGGPRLSPAWGALLVALALCVGTGGTVLAAQGALPGDPLYAVKTTVEGVRLAVTPPEGDVGLNAELANRRLEEINALVRAGRPAGVAQAAEGYEIHVVQALQGLAAAAGRDAGAGDRLSAQLDEALARQTVVLGVLAAQAPVQAAPALERAQAVSAGAQNALRQRQGGSGSGGPPATQTAGGPPAAQTPASPGEAQTAMPSGTPTATAVTPAPVTPVPVTPAPATPAPATPAPATPASATPEPPPTRVPPVTPTRAVTMPPPPSETRPVLTAQPTGTRFPERTPEGTRPGPGPQRTPVPPNPPPGTAIVPPALNTPSIPFTPPPTVRPVSTPVPPWTPSGGGGGPWRPTAPPPAPSTPGGPGPRP